ncbi:MAG: glycosyltransferase family 2 protein [Chitinophagaceae bacterium]
MKVSVLMPAYNAERYITQSIESVLVQSLADFELIILDDNSSDKTYDIITSYAKIDKRIKCFRNDSNRGIGYCRNFLMNISNGEYYAFLDADDISEPNRLEVQSFFLDHNPEIFGIGGGRLIIDKDGFHIKSLPIDSVDRDIFQISCKILFCNCFCNSTMMFRSTKIRFIEEYSPAEDYEFWSRLFLIHKFKLININMPIVKYRVHDNNTSSRNQSRQLSLNDKIVTRNVNHVLGNSFVDIKFIHHHLNPLFRFSESFLSYFTKVLNFYLKLYIALNKAKQMKLHSFIRFISWDFNVRVRVYAKSKFSAWRRD